MTDQSKITGALFDFVGYITSREKSMTVGAKHSPDYALESLLEFLELRNITMEVEPDFNWYKEESNGSDET